MELRVNLALSPWIKCYSCYTLKTSRPLYLIIDDDILDDQFYYKASSSDILSDTRPNRVLVFSQVGLDILAPELEQSFKYVHIPVIMCNTDSFYLQIEPRLGTKVSPVEFWAVP